MPFSESIRKLKRLLGESPDWAMPFQLTKPSALSGSSSGGDAQPLEGDPFSLANLSQKALAQRSEKGGCEKNYYWFTATVWCRGESQE